MRFDLSGVRIRVDDPDPARRERMAVDWAPFRDESQGREAAAGPGAGQPPQLDVAVTDLDEPSRSGPYRPKAMQAEFSGEEARFAMDEGSALAVRPGRLAVRLLRSIDDRPYFTLMNFVRAGLAWCMAARGMALVHAAGLAVDGRGFALVGPEGSGKTTWARLAAEGGAQVLSDDLLFVDTSRGLPELLGAPFRSTYRSPLVPGRWPLAAWLSPEHAGEASLQPMPTMLLRARLAANLTFVAEALERDSATAQTLEALCAAPCRTLRFARDPAFLEALRSFRVD